MWLLARIKGGKDRLYITFSILPINLLDKNISSVKLLEVWVSIICSRFIIYTNAQIDTVPHHWRSFINLRSVIILHCIVSIHVSNWKEQWLLYLNALTDVDKIDKKKPWLFPSYFSFCFLLILHFCSFFIFHLSFGMSIKFVWNLWNGCVVICRPRLDSLTILLTMNFHSFDSRVT